MDDVELDGEQVVDGGVAIVVLGVGEARPTRYLSVSTADRLAVVSATAMAILCVLKPV